MTNTLRHIESMQATARALEEHARKIGLYTRDCDMLDNALKAGKSGFVVLLGDSGEPEIHRIGRHDGKVSVEKTDRDHWAVTFNHPERKQEGPTPMKTKREEEDAERRGNAGQSWESNYEPAERKTKQTADALRAKQTAEAAREKAIRAEGQQRNERIAAAMKAASDKQWGNRSA